MCYFILCFWQLLIHFPITKSIFGGHFEKCPPWPPGVKFQAPTVLNLIRPPLWAFLPNLMLLSQSDRFLRLTAPLVVVECRQKKTEEANAPIQFLYLNSKQVQANRQLTKTKGNIYNDRQRLNQTEGTKYKEESNMMRWKQVIQMMRTMHRWLMREWVQEWRQEDPGKCSADDRTDWCRRGLWRCNCKINRLGLCSRTRN